MEERLLPPFLKHDNVNTSRSTSNSTEYIPKHRRPPSQSQNIYHQHPQPHHPHQRHQPDMLSLDLSSSPTSTLTTTATTNKKPPPAIYYKDKKFPPTIRRTASSSSFFLYGGQHAKWFKLLAILLGLLFIFGYLPLYHFVTKGGASGNGHSKQQHRWDIQHGNQQQQQNLFHTERDKIILYRIIGNDLPPRHKEGQTLSNLQFILDHEPNFPNTQKIFLLNRIIDPVNEATIIRLLDRYNMDYIRVPFDEEEYSRIDFDLEKFPDADFLHSDDYRRFSKVSKLRALDYTYHLKNLYAMNNNGGRNTAIRHGRSLPYAKWIMPFDGNCYLSRNGFKEITTQLERYGDDIKYFIVPMTRLLNNSVLLNNEDERPKTPEEPQIIFRHDATEEYNLNMRYGRRSKLELLWRLGALENRRLNRPTVPWEPVERPYSKDKGNFKNIGWVFRLFSGNPSQEENKKEASSIRAFNRLMAIQSSLDSLDENIARKTFNHNKLFIYNEQPMNQLRYEHWTNHYEIRAAIDRLEEKAKIILEDSQKRLAPQITTTSTPSSLDPSSERHPQGAVAFDSTMLSTASHSSATTSEKDELGPLSKNVTILTLANYFTGEEKYGRAAANLIRVNFLNEYAVEDEDEYNSARRIPDDSHLLDFLSDQGYYFPSMSRISHVIPKYSHNRILNTSDLTKTDISSLLDCFRLLRHMQALTHKEYIDLQGMTAEFLEYLVTSPTGIHLAQMTDHRGVLYDLQVIAMAAFTDDVRLFLRVANRCRMRIGKQFTEDGAQPYEASSTRGRILLLSASADIDGKTEWKALLHYETLNLQYWTLLARGIQNAGIAKDIWHYAAANRGQISHSVVQHLKKYSESLPKLTAGDAAFVKSRLQPLAYMAQEAFSYSHYANTPVDSSVRARTEANRLWMVEHMTDFGERWDSNGGEELDFNMFDIEQDIAKLMYDDEAKGRLGIPPFWMLTSIS
ncbi:alginate lyase-domain-containing protein [Mycotypha africana]|uniref:alginate lyase-domain-containing protein n=1 Tax=Mycotypha africana TaxID=64632 RepID=UPI00230033AF|nr:alginate lyase-domain-containing protein [Mycotypha africana]KAI8973188.1 alginate lyase-domain-containing protein [Mycotypha africana]